MSLAKAKWALPVFLLCIVEQAQAWNKMCSVVCGNQSCSTAAYAACSGQCSSPWTWNSTTNACELLATSGWGVVDVSSDIGGQITPSSSATATCGPQTGGSDWGYTFYGNMSGPAVIQFQDTVGVLLPHYQLRIIFWTILMDNWGGGDLIKATLEGNQTQTSNKNNRTASEKTCGNGGDWDDYVRFDRTYTHNVSTPYTIDITTNSSNSKWGVKELIVLAKLCHPACTACFGSFITQCWAC